MPDPVSIKTDGFKALAEALRALPQELSADILEGAVRAGAELIAQSAQSKAPRRHGRLARSITTRTLERTADRADVLVQAKAPHAHLVELGHRLVKGGRLGRGGRVVGHVPAHPFLRPAFDEQAESAVRRMGEVMGRTIDESQALRRLGARRGGFAR